MHKKLDNTTKGLVFMVLATFFFGIMNVSVKYISHIPATEVVLFRSIISFVICMVGLLIQKENPWGTHHRLLFKRGLFGACALVFFFITLQAIPLATAVTIQYLAPIFGSIMAIFLLKEKIHPLQFGFFGLSFVGILLIKGIDTQISLFYFALGLLGALFAGLAFNYIKKLSKLEHPLVIILYFPIVSIPLMTIITIFNWKMPTGDDWMWILIMGICTQLAQYFMTKSYKLASLAKIAGIKYIGIIYALSFGVFLFDEQYTFLTLVGMGLVLLGVLLNTFFNAKKHA